MDRNKYFKITDESSKRELYRYLKKRKFPFTVIIRPLEKIRSIEQNSYLWVLYRYISQHTGYYEWELHKMFKEAFLSKLILKSGQLKKENVSTKQLSTWLFNDYCEKIRIFAESELSLQLPLPNELLTDELIFDIIYKYY